MLLSKIIKQQYFETAVKYMKIYQIEACLSKKKFLVKVGFHWRRSRSRNGASDLVKIENQNGFIFFRFRLWLRRIWFSENQIVGVVSGSLENKPIKMPTRVQILALKKTWHCDWLVLTLLLLRQRERHKTLKVIFSSDVFIGVAVMFASSPWWETHRMLNSVITLKIALLVREPINVEFRLTLTLFFSNRKYTWIQLLNHQGHPTDRFGKLSVRKALNPLRFSKGIFHFELSWYGKFKALIKNVVSGKKVGKDFRKGNKT